MCIVRICRVEFWGVVGDFCFNISPLGMYFGHVSIHTKFPCLFWCQLHQFFTGLLAQLILNFQAKQTVVLKQCFDGIASVQQHNATEHCRYKKNTMLPGDLTV